MSAATDKYVHMNHFHEIDDDHQVVDFGDGAFIANNDAVLLLRALAEVGLRTRTHHLVRGEPHAFLSILLEGVTLEVRQVNEGRSRRSQYNGMTELLIQWKPAEAINEH